MKHVIAGVIAALTLAGCSTAGDAVGKIVDKGPTPVVETRIGEAADGACTSLRYVADAGQSITFDTQGEDETADDGPFATYPEMVCVLAALKIPEHVIQHIDSTSANDGPQTDTWDGFEARWKYHPDDGIDLTVVDKQFKTN